MKTFKAVFIKNGLKYETYWQALSKDNCIDDIEKLFTCEPDYGSIKPQNAVMSVEEMPDVEDESSEWEDTFGADYES